MKRRNVFGGILWDAFLIVVICVGGFVAWRARARWLPLVPSFPSGALFKRAVTPESPTAAISLVKQSAAVQAKIREILTESGVREKDIAKSFTEQKGEKKYSWLESTLEIGRPSPFNEGEFLRRILVYVSQSGLVLMREDRTDGKWIMELGDRDHVFQRIVIRGKH